MQALAVVFSRSAWVSHPWSPIAKDGVIIIKLSSGHGCHRTNIPRLSRRHHCDWSAAATSQQPAPRPFLPPPNLVEMGNMVSSACCWLHDVGCQLCHHLRAGDELEWWQFFGRNWTGCKVKQVDRVAAQPGCEPASTCKVGGLMIVKLEGACRSHPQPFYPFPTHHRRRFALCFALLCSAHCVGTRIHNHVRHDSYSGSIAHGPDQPIQIITWWIDHEPWAKTVGLGPL
jgi:hypothetical protein